VKNLSIKILAIVIIVVMSVAVIGRSASDFFQTQQILVSVDEMVEKAYPLSERAHSIRLNVVQVQQWLTDISATRGLDGLNDGFDEAAKHADLLRADLAAAKQLDAVNAAQYDELSVVFEAYYLQGQKMANAYVAQGPVGGNLLMADFDAAAANLSQRLEPLLARLADSYIESEKMVEQRVVLLHDIGVITTVLLVLILAALSWLLLSKIVTPLRQVVSMTRDLAEGEGDLSKRLDDSAMGEIGELSCWVNRFISSVQSHVNNIAVATTQLRGSSSELRDATASTNDIVQMQQRETDMVSTAINEMAATVQEVAGHALSAASAAHMADESGKKGIVVVDETVTAITSLASSIEEASSVMQTVEASSENISNVSEVISAIAEQTNLLALNAAIEAARAGEQGRGFAVVADEVRALAQRTQESIVEIRQTIEGLQQSTTNAVRVMVESQGNANACVQEANNTQQALADIAGAVATINDMNAQIASAAEEQGAVAEEINRNVVNIRTVSDDTSVEAGKVARIGGDIEGAAESLQGLLQQFKY
jgi:methyl-accepting chemotaxis protein